MDQGCAGVCGDNVVGQIGENLIETVADVEKEENCWQICKETTGCLYFTHFNADNILYPGLCLLLKELTGPFKTCSNCTTSPVDCSSNQLSVCGLLKEDRSGNQVEKKQLFTSTVKTDTLRQVRVGHCRPAELAIVAIGGGGGGGSDLACAGQHQSSGCYQGGSGSGYISSTKVPAIFSRLFVQVGSEGKSSFVHEEDGTVVVSAEPGTCGGGLDGGNGYSGGGGPNPGDGGSNGTDGVAIYQDGYGGIGSGVDLTQLPVDLFVLTPGRGGDIRRSYDKRGGGGGGVLIDGGGPDGFSSGGSGEGYGGGAGGSSSLGLPGVVVIEYKELPTPGAPTTTTITTTTTSTTSTTTSTATSITTSMTTTSTTTPQPTTTTTPQPSTIQSGGNCKTNFHSIILAFSMFALMF